VKNVALALLFLSCVLVWAAPSASDYDISVHVSATRMVFRGSSAGYQSLSVILNGKRYELESLGAPNALLMLGDYKARLVKDQHWQGLTILGESMSSCFLTIEKGNSWLWVNRNDPLGLRPRSVNECNGDFTTPSSL
jgi:hypothetical protein